jgi:zinc transporter 5/7
VINDIRFLLNIY